jgi:outer membrane PBP1 activator LpoA protein
MPASGPSIIRPATPAAAVRNGLAAALLTCLVTACSTTGWEAETPAGSAIVPEAVAAFAGGDYATAAAAWESEALTAAPDQAAVLRVNAADAWLLAGRAQDAERALRGVSKANLAPADQSRLNLVLADLALWAARPDEAESLLQQASTALPVSSRGRYRDLQERTRQMRSSPSSMGLARARQIAGSMRSYDPAAAVELMRALETVSSGELSVRATNPRDDQQWVGWLDLALVIRHNLVIPDNVGPDVGQWKRRYPYHMLTETEALDSWLRYRQLFAPPGRTAVLLPDTSGLQRASDAIRDGLLSAFLAQPGRGEVLFYSTLDDEQSTIAAYLSAFDAGAQQVIGPLRKEAVENLVSLPGLATPVLALNDLPEPFLAPPGLEGQLAGLSLNQEAEVAAIAAHAAASGYRRAIVIAPESPWGERMASTFEAKFLQDERQIIAATRYLESENDHSAVLERVLLIDESKARAQRLENVLQMPLEFEPTRRTDVDVIFMAAIPTQAKLLRPQLRFLDAGNVPVYATSRVYNGQPDTARNQDLDGIRFPITPWELAHATEEDVPELASLRGGAMASLFALGQDAWNILTWLDLMRKDPQFVFPGQSGYYRIGSTGRIDREPAWAQFELGRPVAVSMPAATTAASSVSPSSSRVITPGSSGPAMP